MKTNVNTDNAPEPQYVRVLYDLEQADRCEGLLYAYRKSNNFWRKAAKKWAVRAVVTAGVLLAFVLIELVTNILKNCS